MHKKKIVATGQGMHLEYHNINPKKEKASDCVYLTEDRICQNKDSYYYLGKCFVASDCPLKLKSTDGALHERD